jgi:DNA-binding MarR family transcriptional regulator
MSVAKPEPAAAPKGCTHLKLRQLSRIVGRHYEAHVVPTGLRNMQYSLLSHVVKLGPLGCGELARTMRLDPSTLSRNLKPLVERGLLRLHLGEGDARNRIVEASAEGVALRAHAQRAWRQAQLALNQTLGDARVSALHALVDDCIALLDPEEKTADG